METFGAMAKTEKIAFILEQVCILNSSIVLLITSTIHNFFIFGLKLIMPLFCAIMLELIFRSGCV